jgi:hypothetical protein
MHCKIIRFTAEDLHCKNYANAGLQAQSPSTATELSQLEDCYVSMARSARHEQVPDCGYLVGSELSYATSWCVICVSAP